MNTTKTIYKTANGLELLTDWDNYQTQRIKAIKGLKALLPCLEILHGDIENNLEYTFGLPYTSTSNFAGIWNTNTTTRLKGTSLYFHGIALSADNLPVAYFIELDEEGNELCDHFKIIC